MSLPINIKDLVSGHSIEWERLEFKKSWNPETIIHSICAFANDINNWGGGYIIIGIEEDNGQPILPPVGIPAKHLDDIQGKVIEMAHQITPHYFPLMQPYVWDDKHILVLWCPAGDNRPYSCPTALGKKSQKQSYIRLGSRSIIAKDENWRRLQELTARVPFDDRINRLGKIDDFDLTLIQAYLQEIKSDLYDDITSLSLAEVSRKMWIAKGADEELLPINVGLLFFTQQPERFFSRAWIELVIHKDNSGKEFEEIYFKGPLHHQLRAVLNYLKSNVIHEKIIKVEDQAESIRVYNYPFLALEEAISNAVYHKSYEIGKPIEIQIWFDKIEILSFPGPIPPVDAQILAQQKRIVSRDYRNRRIGDFLKELKLTEGRGTGFPTIYKVLENNNSPKPIFETDNQSTYFLCVLTAHQAFLNNESNVASNVAGNGNKKLIINNIEDISRLLSNNKTTISNLASNPAQQVKEIIEKQIGKKAIPILLTLEKEAKSRMEILTTIQLSNQTKNRQRHIDPLIEYGWIEFTIPDNLTHKNQKYKLTEIGRKLVAWIFEK